MKHGHYIKVSFSFGFIWTLALFIFGSFFNTTSSYTDVIEITFSFLCDQFDYLCRPKKKNTKKTAVVCVKSSFSQTAAVSFILNDFIISLYKVFARAVKS